MATVLFLNLKKSKAKAYAAALDCHRFGHTVIHLMEKPAILFDNALFCSPNKEDFFCKAKEIINAFDVDYVTTQTDLFVPILDDLNNETRAKIIPELKNFKINDIVDKINFAYFCQNYNLNHPRFWIPNLIENLIQIQKEYTGPIFIKPSNSTAGTNDGFNHENRYGDFDYRKFDSVNHFQNYLISTNQINKFFRTQQIGSEFSNDKGIKNIKGKHIIQENMFLDKFFAFSGVVYNKSIFPIYFSNFDIEKCNRDLSCISVLAKNRSYIMAQEHNQNQIESFLTKDVYFELMYQIKTLVDIVGIHNAFLTLEFYIPDLSNVKKSMMQDINFRLGGSYTNQIINGVESFPHCSLWKYIT